MMTIDSFWFKVQVAFYMVKVWIDYWLQPGALPKLNFFMAE